MPEPTQNTDLAGEAVGFLTDPYRHDPGASNLTRALATAFQDLENAAFVSLAQRRLATAELLTLPATNFTLDILGRLVGQQRADSPDISDATFQALIYLRIAVNRSGARAIDKSRFAAILLRTSGGGIIYTDAVGAPASYFFVGDMTLPPTAVASILGQARGNGIGPNTFAYSTWPDGNDFEFADASSLSTTGQGAFGDAIGGAVGGLLVSGASI